MPCVSVIIPTYNYARFLPAALESVLAQTYKDFEIIVIDDGSTDNTAAAVAPFRHRVRYERQENKGLSAARNRGLELCRGEFVALLDADDEWLPGKLAAQIPVFDDPQVGMVYCDLLVRWPDGREGKSFLAGKYPAAGWVFESLIAHSFIMPSAAVIRRFVLEAVGGFDTDLVVHEDIDCWLRIARRWAAGFVPEPLAVRREHGHSLVSRRDERALMSVVHRWEKLLSLPGLTEGERTAIELGLAESLMSGGYYLNKSGERRKARKSLLRSLRYAPWRLATWRSLVATLLPGHRLTEPSPP